jgi:hypothetical protein
MSNNEAYFQEIKGQKFKETLKIIMPLAAVYIQPPYYLNEIDFNIILKPNKIEAISWAVLIFAITMSIEIFAKVVTLFLLSKTNDLISSIFIPSDKFEKWKLIATGLAIILSIALLLLRLIPTKKNKLIKKIRKYYLENPPLLRGIQND